MSTIGYVTVAEADAFVADYYLATSSNFLRWDAMDDTAKAVVLRQALSLLENLSFTGCKSTTSQVLSFPRSFHWSTAAEAVVVPDEIKLAQVELAIMFSNTALIASMESRRSLQEQGVTRIQIDTLQEQYQSVETTKSLLPRGVKELLSKWLKVGYNIERDHLRKRLEARRVELAIQLSEPGNDVVITNNYSG